MTEARLIKEFLDVLPEDCPIETRHVSGEHVMLDVNFARYYVATQIRNHESHARYFYTSPLSKREELVDKLVVEIGAKYNINLKVRK